MSTPFSIRKFGGTMTIKEQYEELQKLIQEIENRLYDNSFEKIKDLIRWKTNSSLYQKLKGKENKLIQFEVFCEIWMQEKLKFPDLIDIFYNVNNLEQLENKYRNIQYAVLRVENNIPRKLCDEQIERIIQERVSGIALALITARESATREKVTVEIADILLNKNIVLAIRYLQYSQEIYKNNSELYLKEAECWLAGNESNIALKCLQKIEKPNTATREMIKDLQRVITDEKI